MSDGAQPRPRAVIETSDLQALGDLLGALDGVEQVVRSVDGIFWLRCDPQVTPGGILRRARTLVSDAGFDPLDVPVELVVEASSRQRRVRFDHAERTENPDRTVTVGVTLEWDGVLHTVEVTGEKGDQIELRTAAHAAMGAAEKVTDMEMNLRLVGVKHLRAFDGDLIVVSMVGGDGDGRRTMLGAVLAGSDPYRATAIAVLMALNRLLGNYLVTR